MRRKIIYLLRILIIVSAFIPVLIPYVKTQIFQTNKEKINILVYEKMPDNKEKEELQKKLRQYFKKEFKINYLIYGNIKQSKVLDFEDLLNKIDKIYEPVIILSKADFFGEEALFFNTLLNNTIANKEKRLYFFDENTLSSNVIKDNYLVASHVFLPKTIFVGIENSAIVSIIGKGKPNTKIQVNLELYSGTSFLNSKRYDITVPDNGVIAENVEVPVQFFKIGVQSIIASISTYPSVTIFPLNTVFTTVQVAYAKTAVLHLAFAPDWSLRIMREKLKFWPNLDLLSYYILREIKSDQSVPSSELSLIEFPSQKLFGTELANLHGIIAQNFLFGTYLREEETHNLIQYVKNGGRLVIQAGELSFSDYNPLIHELFPCKNQPQWDKNNSYNWEENTTNFSLPALYSESLNHIVSHSAFTNCIPKENTIVLAKAKETQAPILTAMPLEKGIVVTFLTDDWLFGYTSFYQEYHKPYLKSLNRMEYADASDSVFQWMVEFLQRKQDSGIHAPEFSGPRIYAEDKNLIIKSNGGLNLKKDLVVQSANKKSITSRPFFVKNLKVEMLELETPLKNILNSHVNNSLQNLEEITINPQDQKQQLFKFKSLPIFSGSEKSQENVPNPLLFKGIQTVNNMQSFSQQNEKLESSLYKYVPLLLVYPWLLAATLFLLALEQFLSRILWKYRQ